jgi:uncharacterized membrane protein
MGPDEQQETRLDQQAQLAATIAALSLRVEALERELAQLRAPSTNTAPPPRQTIPATETAPPPDFARHLPKPEASLEDRIGSQLFSRIGIIALLIATTLFLKWAIDNQWIGPIGRILAGLLAGAAVIIWSERFRRKGFPAFSYALKAIGSGALYLSLWAAFQLYHLLPAAATLAAMIFVTAWNAYMAWAQDSELLAAYALTGALAAPLLLSTGGNHESFLFIYILAIDIATIVLIRLKSWPRLLFGVFPATVAYFIGWYISWYDASRTNQPLIVTTIFLALFFATFVTPSLGSSRSKPTSPVLEIFLPLANATFIALALYSVFEDAGYRDLLPWLAVLLAAIYLVLNRLPQSRVASEVHLATAIVFLTIAIPLKATGRWITIGWLTEGVALLWISSRLSTPTASESSQAQTHSEVILRRLSALALTLGTIGLLVQSPWLYDRINTPFLNPRFATNLFGLAALATSALISLRAPRHRDQATPHFLSIAAASIIALNLTAILACIRELDTTWQHAIPNSDADLQRSLAISAFLMLYGAALLTIGFWRRSAFLRWQALTLLVFTIAKTFLYDLRNLSQGYRVVSFLGLGALLMAISFAYQKDWLSLRGLHNEAGPFDIGPHPAAKHEAEQGAGH